MSSPSPSTSTTTLTNPEIEANAIAILLRYGAEIWGDFTLIDRLDFSEAHRPIFDHIKLQLDTSPPGSVDPLLLSEKMRTSGIGKLEGDFNPYDYLQGLKDSRYVEKEQAPSYVKELKRLRVRRDLIVKLDSARRELVGKPNASFDEMTGLVEKTVTSVTTDYHKGDEFSNVFGDIIEVTEARADSPVDASQLGWMGPFATVNQVLGALSGPGLMTCIGARTGNQKSSLGFHYHVHIAEKYDIPVLLLDVGEMSKERIQRRAVCNLSKGRVPLWAVASGEWRQNKEWKHIIQDECWPRVKKLKIDYINVGNLSPREKLSLIRRYYYQKVGRGNPLAILDDYLKGVEALGKNSSEHQAVGYYVNDIKNLITGEILASFWTSVQNNRTGSYQGKKASEITDSEDQMGLSDRIIQQSDWGFVLRFKVPEELAAEKDLFGNMKLTPVKTREALGKDSEKALRPIKLPNGKFATNYFNLESKGFHFTEKGDLRRALEVLGQSVINMGSGSADDKHPAPRVQPL